MHVVQPVENRRLFHSVVLLTRIASINGTGAQCTDPVDPFPAALAGPLLASGGSAAHLLR